MKLLHTLKPIAAVVAGNIIVAFAIAVFILPKNLIAGGTTGLAIILNHFFGLNISLVVLIFNGFMFFFWVALLGKKFALTTILSTIIFPTFLTYFRTVPALQDMTDDILLKIIQIGHYFFIVLVFFLHV